MNNLTLLNIINFGHANSMDVDRERVLQSPSGACLEVSLTALRRWADLDTGEESSRLHMLEVEVKFGRLHWLVVRFRVNVQGSETATDSKQSLFAF